GVDMEGIKHVLGIWVQTAEGAKFWAGVCAELANRGVADVLIVCCDGLTGFPEAIEATWPKATVQTCVVHLIRTAMRFVSYNQRKLIKNRGHFPSDESVVKLLWLAICTIEDKRAREREKQRGRPPNERTAPSRLIEGQVTTNWKQALGQLAIAYPDRINPYL